MVVMLRKSTAIHDDDLLTETLNTIAAERGNFGRSFELVDDVIRNFGEAGLGERLYEAIPRERPWEDIADRFGILIWSTSDNGSALMQTTEQWLRDGTDVRQVQIALHLDVYPFLERSTMERVVWDVGTKFPEVAERCREIVESRRQQNVYFAARSEAKLESVCEALGAAFDLPPFEFDSHDTWRYAWSEGQGLRLNVMEARGFRTIETWMPGCPSGVNYQVILTADCEPPDFASRLADILGSEVARYATSQEEAER